MYLWQSFRTASHICYLIILVCYCKTDSFWVLQFASSVVVSGYHEYVIVAKCSLGLFSIYSSFPSGTLPKCHAQLLIWKTQVMKTTKCKLTITLTVGLEVMDKLSANSRRCHIVLFLFFYRICIENYMLRTFGKFVQSADRVEQTEDLYNVQQTGVSKLLKVQS